MTKCNAALPLSAEGKSEAEPVHMSLMGIMMGLSASTFPVIPCFLEGLGTIQ